jgi:hypothetical protein
MPLSAMAWGFGGRIIVANWSVCILTITVFGIPIPIPIPIRIVQTGPPSPIVIPGTTTEINGIIFPFISTVYLYYMVRVGPWGLGSYIYPFPPPGFNQLIGFFGANLWCPDDALIMKIGTSLY